MSLAPGSKLAHYVIGSRLGAGAMGEVFGATDTRLDREVAIKVLPEHFARDVDRLQRFEREAKALASLNHPNVAQIHGFDKIEDTCFLVLELVPGETLAEKIAHGPLSIEEALGVCVQIAAGVEAAHEAGVIHRDLKPGNVKLTPDGKVKVLDFGLARQDRPKDKSATISNEPMTEAGVLLGTPGYMSPEQVRGKPIDRRTDIFAFGCVLFACLVGTPAFPGETSSDVLAAILEREPDLDALPAKVSPRVRELLAQCLEKDPSRRLHDIGDARIDLERAIANKEWSTSRLETVSGGKKSSAARLPWIAGALLGAAAAAITTFAATRFKSAAPSSTSQPPALTRFVVNPPGFSDCGEYDTTATVAVSPDGTTIAFAGREHPDSPTQIYLRKLGAIESTLVTGSQLAHEPVFSPDGAWLCFSSQDKLFKTPVAGGARIELAKLPGLSKGIAWGAGGIICSPAASSGLFSISAEGGELVQLTQPDASKGEISHRWPEILPDGRHVICTIKRADLATFDEAEIAVYSLDTHAWKTLVRGGSFAKYSPTGHLLYSREGQLMAAPFDLERLELTGAATRVLSGVMTEPGSGAAQFAISNNGTLVFAPGGAREKQSEPVWIDRGGKATPVGMPVRPYGGILLSPDEKRIAGVVNGATDSIFVFDMTRGTVSRVTFEGNTSILAWTPDGESLIYTSDREGGAVFRSRIDGSGAATKLLSEPVYRGGCVASDGAGLVLLYPKGRIGSADIWKLSLEVAGKEEALIQAPADQASPLVSPDGKWLGFVSNESGQYEVYVIPFPSGVGRWQISKRGAYAFWWSADGTKIFHMSGDENLSGEAGTHRTLNSVPISTTRGFEPGAPELVCELTGVFSSSVTKNGEKVLALRDLEPKFHSTEIDAVLNWSLELQQKVPVR